MVSKNRTAVISLIDSSTCEGRGNLKNHSDGKLYWGVLYFVPQKGTKQLAEHFPERDYKIAFTASYSSVGRAQE